MWIVTKRTDSIFRCCMWALKSYEWGKNCTAPSVYLQKFGMRQKL